MTGGLAETCLIWMEGWSLECCGTPAAVGDEVAWWVTDTDDAEHRHFASIWGPVGGRIAAVENSHAAQGEEVREARFRVRGVWAGYCSASDSVPAVLVEGSGELVPMSGMVEPAPARAGLVHGGWLVEVSVLPAPPSLPGPRSGP